MPSLLRILALAAFLGLALAGIAPGAGEPAGFAVALRGAAEAGGRWTPWMALYIGPEILLPFASAIAAVAGFVMMFWRRLVGWARRLWDWAFRRSA